MIISDKARRQLFKMFCHEWDAVMAEWERLSAAGRAGNSTQPVLFPPLPELPAECRNMI